MVVLAGELLREAEKLVDQRIHPMTIIDGWRLAVQQAREALDASAIDHSSNEEEFRQDLINIAKTTLSSKLLTHEKDHFARLAVDAVLRLKDSANLDYIQIIKKSGGALRESFLDEGFIMDKKIGVGQPKRVENAKILIANTSMDTDKIKVRCRPLVAGRRLPAAREGQRRASSAPALPRVVWLGMPCQPGRSHRCPPTRSTALASRSTPWTRWPPLRTRRRPR